jgi:hypothetical protein
LRRPSSGDGHPRHPCRSAGGSSSRNHRIAGVQPALAATAGGGAEPVGERSGAPCSLGGRVVQHVACREDQPLLGRALCPCSAGWRVWQLVLPERHLLQLLLHCAVDASSLRTALDFPVVRAAAWWRVRRDPTPDHVWTRLSRGLQPQPYRAVHVSKLLGCAAAEPSSNLPVPAC